MSTVTGKAIVGRTRDVRLCETDFTSSSESVNAAASAFYLSPSKPKPKSSIVYFSETNGTIRWFENSE